MDLENIPLEIRSDSEAGSSHTMSVNFYTSEDATAGMVTLDFKSPIKYQINYCSDNLNLPVPPPPSTEKIWIWKITLNKVSGIRLMIQCNDVLVLNYLLSDTTCGVSYWGQYWKKDVAKIEFPSHDTAADSYRTGI